ncbi:polyketide synthase dehydratase domain-containing protein [Kribbella sp. NPDC056861]|uniref:polyketide synthase dehydratase domain-containing protein n=1 Tax=Kribbella sp. NPDC056861 TaxID=3154857 RepID=UPI00342C9E77
MLGRSIDGPLPIWETELSPAAFPYLGDHRVGENVVFPGAGYVEAALAMFDDETPCRIENLAFHRLLVLDPATINTLRLSFDPTTREITMYGRRTGDDPAWVLHANGRRSGLADPTPPGPRSLSLEVLTAGLNEVERASIYARFERAGLRYGPAFQDLRRLWLGTEEVVAEIEVEGLDVNRYQLHPAVLDAAFQALLAVLRPQADGTSILVPVEMAEIRFSELPVRVNCGLTAPGAAARRPSGRPGILCCSPLTARSRRGARRTPFAGRALGNQHPVGR